MTSSVKMPRDNPYDDWIGRMIPGYDVMHRLGELCLSAELRSKARVLMVGVGTGPEVVISGERHPGWAITAVEPDARMSALGRKKIAARGLASRVRWHEGPLVTLKPTAPFNAATIIIVLQFLPDPMKLELLREIGRRLKPNAPLFLATFIGDEATAHTENAYDLMRAWAIENGIDPVEARKRISHQREGVHLVTEGKMTALMRRAGFVDPRRIYQALPATAWIVRTKP